MEKRGAGMSRRRWIQISNDENKHFQFDVLHTKLIEARQVVYAFFVCVETKNCVTG